VAQRVKIVLPIPHPKQKEIEDSDAKRKVVITGRRFGKTTHAARKAVRGLLHSKRVLYAAPVEAQTEVFWRYCKAWLAPLLSYGLYKSESPRLLRLEGLESLGEIQARTAFKPDSLRSDYADELILDEYAYQDPAVWEDVCQPMLLDTNGNAIFYTTPNLKNHAYILYLKAKADTTGRWQAWHGTTYDNPHLSQEVIDELVADMTEDSVRQEIMAEFLESAGQVFRPHPADFVPAKTFAEQVETHAGHRLVSGIDWGRISDATVQSLGCATCSKELFLDRFIDVDYPTQRDRIKGVYTRYQEKGFEVELLGESNSMGLPNIEQLREDGVPILEWWTSHQSKAQLVQALRLCFEQRAWTWLDDPLGKQEIETYAASVTIHGNVTYNAPKGLTDDIVIARMLMLHQAIAGTFTLG